MKIFSPTSASTPLRQAFSTLAHFQVISARIRFRSWIQRFLVSLYPYFMISKINAASHKRDAIKSLGVSSLLQTPTSPNLSTHHSPVKSDVTRGSRFIPTMIPPFNSTLKEWAVSKSQKAGNC